MSAKIVYVGDVSPGQTALYRAQALRELGAEVCTVAPKWRPGRLGKLTRALAREIHVGSEISALNAEVASASEAAAGGVLWVDKGWMLWPRTYARAKALGMHVVLFNNDNPWGKIEPRIWRHLHGSLRHIDTAIIPRYSSVQLYRAGGVRRVIVTDFGYSESEHKASPTVGEFDDEICFVGTAYRDGMGVRPDRTRVMAALSEIFPGQVSVYGHGWSKVKGKFNRVAPPQLGPAYRERISRSRINLAFVTWANREETSHKAFEIAACGGLLLAERTPRLENAFMPDEEALFFSGIDDCADQIRRVLDQRISRSALVEAALSRSKTGGYDDRSRLFAAINSSPELRDRIVAGHATQTLACA